MTITINRLLVIGVIAALGNWGSAQAGDRTSPIPVWSGLYVGGHLGAAFDGPDSSLKTTAHTRQFKTIGHGECFDSAGNQIDPPIGANKAKCEEPTQVPFAHNFTPAFDYGSHYTNPTPASCTKPVSGAITLAKCNAAGGVFTAAAPATCQATSGPNSGTFYTGMALNNSTTCQNAVGGAPNTCVVTAGPNAGTYTGPSVNSNTCNNTAGTFDVPSPYTWINSNFLINNIEDLMDLAKNDDTHFIGGVHFGIMSQTGRLVAGVEYDFSFFNDGVETLRSQSSIHSVNEGKGPPMVTDMTTTATGQFGVENFGTARLKVGYAVNDKWLPFVTGGLAIGKVVMKGQVVYEGNWCINENANCDVVGRSFGGTDRFSDNDYQAGYTVGAGVNYRASDRILIGLTYLFIDLGNKSARSSFEFADSLTRGNPNAPDQGNQSFQVEASGSAHADIDASFQTVRLSASYLFYSPLPGDYAR